MPNAILIPSAQNLPDGFCPTSWQDTLNTFSSSQRITLPVSLSQITISQNPPPPADQDKIWFKVDANNHILSINSYDSSSGTWERADEIPYYFNDFGSANNVQITTGENLSDAADIVGRLFIVKVLSANTTTTPTLTVDTIPAKQIKKYGANDVAIGDYEDGMICLFIYDGTSFQLLNIVAPLIPVVQIIRSSTYNVPGVGGVQAWNHNLGEIPDFFDCYFVCAADDQGYVASSTTGPDQIHYSQIEYTEEDVWQSPAFVLSADKNALSICRFNNPAGLLTILNKTTGTPGPIDTTKWNMKFVVTKLTPAQ